MNEKVSKSMRRGILKSLTAVRNIKDDSQAFFDNLLEQGAQLVVENAVPNEELHYTLSVDESAVLGNSNTESETMPEPDELMEKLCECSTEDFERLKNMIAEAEQVRNNKKA